MIEKYGVKWKDGTEPLQIEMACVRKGGRWTTSSGAVAGLGRIYHCEQMRKIIWPELDDHRWHRICRDEILRDGAKTTALMGPGSTAKTHEASWAYLCEWMASPEDTCVLVSSTDIRGLKLRVWGEITMLWQKAVERFDYLPGHNLESRIAITYDSIEDGDFSDRNARDMRKAICGIPCVQDKKFVGLAKYHGIKQVHVRLIADECSMMGISFLKSFANLNNNPDFQATVLFNPNDPLDPGGQAAEPKDGWSGHISPVKTEVWDTKFMNGRCVNLIGTDSPNFDDPQQPNRYPYLIGPKKIAETVSAFGKDSFEYFTQCIGAMKVSTLSRRVITRDLCRKFGALDKVVWRGTPTTKIAGLDAAYGGDRCALTIIEFGMDVRGKIVIKIDPVVIVPLNVRDGKREPMIVEDQISHYVKEYCEGVHVPPENFYHDSTGRGSLGTSLARIWSSLCNPVEFGGKPTPRPVSLDHWVYDDKQRIRRLKRCDEHYSKWVTEAWYSVRYAIESEQIRELPEDVMEEGCLRQWDKTKDSKIELETKQDMKDRVGRSCDLFDSLVIAVEGARRKGFQISKLGSEEYEDGNQWLFKLQRRQQALTSRMSLSYK